MNYIEFLNLRANAKKMIKRLFLLFGLFFVSLSFAQTSDFGNWLIYIGNKKINEKWNIHNEIQYRNYNLIGDLEQLLLSGVGYNIHENINLTRIRFY